MQQLSLTEIFSKRHDQQVARPYNLGLLLASLALISIGFIMLIIAYSLIDLISF